MALSSPVPPLLTLLALAYGIGAVRRWRRQGVDAWRERGLRAAAFVAALATLGVALVGAVPSYAARLFWVHAAQQQVLILVAAPLLALAAPWRELTGGGRTADRLGQGRALPDESVLQRTHWLLVLLAALVGMVAVQTVWLVPAAADLALRNGAVRAVEQASLVVVALAFWLQVTDSPPFASRLTYAQRAGLLFVTAFATWALAMVLGFSGHPYFHPYALLAHRPGGISALTDQRVGGEVIWAAGMIAYTVAFVLCTYRWLVTQDDADAALADVVRQYVRRRVGPRPLTARGPHR